MNKKLAILAIGCILIIMIGGLQTSQLYGTTQIGNNPGFSYKVSGYELSKWQCRKQIYLNSSLVQSTLTNFPVLIYEASDTDLKNGASSTGNDIIFVPISVDWSTGDPSQRLPHEIEKYNSATGNLIAWVNVSSLSSTSDTIIYMYYNNPDCAGNEQNVTNVWDGNYVYVQHMNESANVFEDSTSYNNDANQTGGATQNASGMANGGITLNGDDDYLRTESSSSIPGGAAGNTQFTLELWMNQIHGHGGGGTGTPAYRIFCKREGISTASWQWTIKSASPANKGVFYTYISGSAPTVEMNGTIPVGSWMYVGCVFNTSRGSQIYINGAPDALTTVTAGGTTRSSVGTPVVIGATYEGSYSWYYHGTLDELRISKKARTRYWINTTYNTIKKPTSFLTFGQQNSDTFYASSIDGDLSKTSSLGYADAHDAITSSGGTNTTNSIYVGQQYINAETSYTIFRGYLFFDTSAIPNSATITAATLSLYASTDASTYADFNLTVQNGQPNYPHNPLQSGDYYYDDYSGNGGIVNSTQFNPAGYKTISLTSAGLSWINKTGVTKLCLRSSRDINSVSPGSGADRDEYVGFYAFEQGRLYWPKLTITYTMP